jgi:hypothetical protein
MASLFKASGTTSNRGKCMKKGWGVRVQEKVGNTGVCYPNEERSKLKVPEK